MEALCSCLNHPKQLCRQQVAKLFESISLEEVKLADFSDPLVMMINDCIFSAYTIYRRQVLDLKSCPSCFCFAVDTK